MSVKDCGHHEHRKKKLKKKIIAGTFIFLSIAILAILIIWAVLKPTKPRFILQDATVYAFNLSDPNLLTSTFQVTVQSRNPNAHIGVYYDRLIVYATYRDQQISLPTSIPPTFQVTNGQNIWSPFVSGVSVPIAPFTGAALSQDEAVGRLMMNFNMDGRVRFKVGTIVSATYHLHVNCPAVIAVATHNAGLAVGNNAMKYQLTQSCTVSV